MIKLQIISHYGEWLLLKSLLGVIDAFAQIKRIKGITESLKVI